MAISLIVNCKIIGYNLKSSLSESISFIIQGPTVCAATYGNLISFCGALCERGSLNKMHNNMRTLHVIIVIGHRLVQETYGKESVCFYICNIESLLKYVIHLLPLRRTMNILSFGFKWGTYLRNVLEQYDL